MLNQLEIVNRIQPIPEVLPYERMQAVVRDKASVYQSAEPFPHIILDDFFDEWILDAILAEFPNPSDKIWERHNFPQEIKLQSKHERFIPPFTRQFLQSLNSFSFLTFLERLTGIEKLIGDPQFEGGGMHQISPGGKLGIHVDFNKHSYYALHRRLNLLVYLNKNWKTEYGGDLELWDSNMSHPIAKIAPLFNRIVIFSTIPYSYHGHPEPLKCPSGMTRKSLALYYYSVSDTAHSNDIRHSTVFQRRPGERLTLGTKQLARELTPPILWRVLSHRLQKMQKR